MIEKYQVEELYERCIELDRKRYDLEDRIEAIMDYLCHSNITLQEMEQVQEIAYGGGKSV